MYVRVWECLPCVPFMQCISSAVLLQKNRPDRLQTHNTHMHQHACNILIPRIADKAHTHTHTEHNLKMRFSWLRHIFLHLPFSFSFSLCKIKLFNLFVREHAKKIYADERERREGWGENGKFAKSTGEKNPMREKKLCSKREKYT